jgi:hypothetical protein
MVPRWFLVPSLTLIASCAPLPQRSHDLNPLGWPAKLASGAGWLAADSGWPVLRETGNLLLSLGELIEAPALLVEGIVTLDADKLGGSGRQLLVGTGCTVTATWNLPFVVVPGRTLDLGRDAEGVNEALAFLETLPVEAWRFVPGDPREFVFPPGTRVRASGDHLVWMIPQREPVLQAAWSNVLWAASQWLTGTSFPAQERSWGFVVNRKDEWDAYPLRVRVELILHEFYHQHFQMREWLMGWTTVYWPAYMVTFPFTGWDGHWAEMQGTHAAGIVDRGLRHWIPASERDR